MSETERIPRAADLKRSVREMAKLGGRTFALAADVSEAHRQVLVAERYWHLLDCDVKRRTAAFVKKVGSRFGTASAAFYWSRVAYALGQHVAEETAHT